MDPAPVDDAVPLPDDDPRDPSIVTQQEPLVDFLFISIFNASFQNTSPCSVTLVVR